MRLHIAVAAALAIGLCATGVAQAEEVPPGFENRPTPAVCYNAVPTVVGSGVIFGGAGPDVIVGSPMPDVIYGLGGDDIILGLGEDDVIYGGAGDDLICAGTGDDQALGGVDHDTVYGEPGVDKMWGGDGRDLLAGLLDAPDEGDGGPGYDWCPVSTEVPFSCV